MTRPLSVALTLGLALVLGAALAALLPGPPPSPPAARVAGTRAPALPSRLLPDCPAPAIRDLRGPGALLCWFADEGLGAWHLTSALEVNGITLAQVVADDRRVADMVAKRFVAQGGPGADELLVYARDRQGTRVTRVRWTPRGGFETTEFDAR